MNGTPEKRLLLIDAHSLIHRCYHALPPFRNSNNEPVGALYGVASLLIKILLHKDTTHIAALFDRPEPTFRKEKFAEYKIHRPKADDELVSQLIEARNLFKAFKIASFEVPGYEGDDLIGTLATRFGKSGEAVVTILTGDHDALQLVHNGRVYVQTFKKGVGETITYDEEGVIARLGVSAAQVVDYKALVGDASDNIPGVPGIGPKTAAQILQKYGTLEGFLKKGKEEKIYSKIEPHIQTALLSQELAQIHCNAPIDVSLSDLETSVDADSIRAYLLSQNFTSLVKRLDGITQNTHELEEKNIAQSDTPSHDSPASSDLIVLDADTKEALLSSKEIKAGYDIKDLFKKHEIRAPYDDLSLAFQLLGIPGSSWQDIALRVFKQDLPYDTFISRGWEWTRAQIGDKELNTVYQKIELPLIPVLAQMEERGIAVDTKKIDDLAGKLEQKINTAQKEIHQELGEELNLNSPKQLLECLREKYGVRILSTSAEVLEKNKEKIPVAPKLLAYRELFKMQTTYVQAFKKLTAPDGRIHPTFVQLGAATGRIACQNPNLQNIPQESVWSKEIRNIFIPQKGYTLLSCDYSQMELRILASLAQDENMIAAFTEGKDIHTLTAQKVFGISGTIDKAMRRTAKTLNFGIVYGMGYRALAQQSGMPSAEAKLFIQRYFQEFSSIKKWQESVLRQAREKGYVTNPNGRPRYIPEIHSTNAFFASSAEREAINMPIQSLGADILKIAMIRIAQHLSKNGLENAVRMLLTIHDELVFEVEESLLKKGKESEIVATIQDIMENAYPLQAPLKTETKIGKRWGEME